jgi:RNA polymerase sigma factor
MDCCCQCQAIFQVQESLRRDELQRDPTEAELAEANNMSVQQLRRRLDVGRAARNKLIKVLLHLLHRSSS